jgi:ubiquitin-activating enzyme E1
MAARISEEVASTEADRYSRQMAALGVDTMRNLMGLTVLVVGVKGVGVETAKDLCLSGPKGVTVWDDDVATIADLGTNFYLQQSHVGVAKCSIVASSLAELNPYVEVKAHTGALTDRFLQSFGAVVITKHLPKADMLRINEVCRSSNVIFILALTYGASCLLFSDFGDHHKITDTDGETVDPMVIESIDQFGVVVCATEKHGLSDGDEVVLTECEGATWLNDLKSVKVKRVYTKERDLDAKGEQKKDSQGNLRWRNIAAQNKIQLDVADELKPRFSEWKNGGLIQYVKPIVDMQFKSLASSLNAPKTANEFCLHHLDDNVTYSGRGDQLQLAFTSLLEFEAKHGRRPALHSVEDANEMVLVARAVNDARKAAEQQSVEEVDADVITKFSLYNRAELSGFCAFLGGVVAQEVVKKFGKYTPVYQWLTVDYFELLQNAIPANANSIGSRYDHQIALFGKAIQDKILAQKWFMVGCGALGCEYMKAFAMMGVGAGKNGCVHITDADTIELSNLSRQFLFRSQHINRFKSVCAAEVVVGMNSDLNVVCHEIRVGPETENIFNDAFWMQFDGIWNALDNIQARLYTDSKCILYGKPLLESGTEGTKANSSVHIPGKTLSYGDLPVQETGKIAACTLRNFPHLIVHCIEWARPRFESMFVFLPKQVNTLLADERIHHPVPQPHQRSYVLLS